MLLLDIIAKKLSINITYEKREFTNRFTKISGDYYGPWLALSYKKFDVIIGAPFYTENAELDFDPTVIYFIDRLRIIVPKSKRIYLILGPFDQLVWRMYMWAILGGICINFLIEMTINTRNRRFWLHVEEILKILLEQGNIQFTKRWSKRILIGAFLLCILLFNSAGKGKIMYFLTGYHYDYQIDTLQEITDAGYKIALFEKLEFISLDASSEEYCKKNGVRCYQDDVFNSLQACKAYSSGKKVEKVAAIKPFTLVIHDTKQFLDKHWVPRIHFISKPLRTIHSKMFFTRGHPLFTVFNNNLLRCFSVGIVDKIRKMDYWMRIWQLISEKPSKCQTRQIVLGLDELKFIIHFYQNAVLVATVVFFLEILFFRISRWYAGRCSKF
ncbi:uncharacterized protein LOC143206616 [Rhynchophorus ferrugineus]|uniref:uncharacterized protein LOC143206616 n=1 Tax=Rhynchophorus ferrugineus TaxID=354439 RepID=UPI003FCD71E2